MTDLREQLRQLLQRRVCLMGLGNVDYADDGFGVRLAEGLKSEGRKPKTEGNPKPETRERSAEVTTENAKNAEKVQRGKNWLVSLCSLRSLRLIGSFAIGSRIGAPADPGAGSYSDFGIRPSFGLRDSAFGFRSRVIVAGPTPERFLSTPAVTGCDHLVFLDAVDFGGAPGAVVLLNSDEMAARYPQISTHKISLGLLAKCAEANGTTKAWLLGVQPESVRPGNALSPKVEATLGLLTELVRQGIACSSRGNEALTSFAPQVNGRGDLSLVTSAATSRMEGTA